MEVASRSGLLRQNRVTSCRACAAVLVLPLFVPPFSESGTVWPSLGLKPEPSGHRAYRVSLSCVLPCSDVPRFRYRIRPPVPSSGP